MDSDADTHAYTATHCSTHTHTHTHTKANIVLDATISTENATSKMHQIQKLKFLGTNQNGRAAARRTAPKLPRAIRVGPNEHGKHFWGTNSRSLSIRQFIYIPKSGSLSLDKLWGTKISIWICTARYRGIWDSESRYGGFRGCCIFSGNCHGHMCVSKHNSRKLVFPPFPRHQKYTAAKMHRMP